MKLDLDIPSTSIIKGDLLSISISAASVIAKVTRDRMMYELDEKYPMYNFKGNKGYPTKEHLEAIKKYGIIPEHRKSYGPVKEYLERKEQLTLDLWFYCKYIVNFFISFYKFDLTILIFLCIS